METFLGHTVEYWMQLDKRARELNVTELIQEIADLYARVGFYEKRIKEMTEFMKKD